MKADLDQVREEGADGKTWKNVMLSHQHASSFGYLWSNIIAKKNEECWRKDGTLSGTDVDGE